MWETTPDRYEGAQFPPPPDCLFWKPRRRGTLTLPKPSLTPSPPSQDKAHPSPTAPQARAITRPVRPSPEERRRQSIVQPPQGGRQRPLENSLPLEETPVARAAAAFYKAYHDHRRHQQQDRCWPRGYMAVCRANSVMPPLVSHEKNDPGLVLPPLRVAAPRALDEEPTCDGPTT